MFHPTLPRSQYFGDPNPGLRIAPGCTQFQTRRRVGELDLRVSISSMRNDEKEAILQPTVDQIAEYWKSPGAALAEYDRLAENCRRQIESGLALEMWTLGGPTGTDPPMLTGPEGNVSDALKREVLAEATTQIEQRKQLIAKHYEEMYRSTRAAFPPLSTVISGDDMP